MLLLNQSVQQATDCVVMGSVQTGLFVMVLHGSVSTRKRHMLHVRK